jgi:hypothetical protein
MLVTVLAFTSCDQFKDAADVEFEHTYKADVEIDIPDGAKSVHFEKKVTINPLSSADFAEYQDLIKDIQINGIDGVVASINKKVTISDLHLIMESMGESFDIHVPTVVFEEGAEINFDVITQHQEMLSNWFNNKQEVNITVSGDSSEDDVQCTFTTETGIKVTANPLK